MNHTAAFEAPPARKSALDWAMALFSQVEAGESVSALLLAANVFILLAAYYILKTVREPLILGQPGGAEAKSMASAGQALLFLFIVPAYGMVASRFRRMGLIAATMLFFISNLAIFYGLGTAGVAVGIPFFLWVGIFNMLVVAQFWSFANDLYSEEQGKRLFPIVGVGASLGAILGAMLAKALFKQMTPYELMGVAAALLGGSLLVTYVVNRRESGRATARAQAPLDRKGGFQLVVKDPYLRWIAVFVLTFNCVNSIGEYLVSKLVTVQAAALPAAQRGAFIGQFYGDYFSWVNLLSFLIQTFLVSRIFRWMGVRGALFILPAVALCGYGILATLPILAIVKVAKILENSTDYSLNNTVRHALFLPTSREAKYKGKAATDTFFVRAGDMVQAAIVSAGVLIGLPLAGFAVLNMGLVGIWLIAVRAIAREHKRLTSEEGAHA
jgi:AAA family ATP:ADP antiporter